MGKKKTSAKKPSSSTTAGRYATMTEDFARHDVGKKKHREIAKAHREEYSNEHSHSMSKVEMFRSHAGSKQHQKDLLSAEKHLGIKVNVKHYGTEAATKAAAEERAVQKARESAEKRRKERLYLEVQKSSPGFRSRPDSIGGPSYSAASPSNANVGMNKPSITIPRPYTLSSPRSKPPTPTPDQQRLSSHSPHRASKESPNVVKYQAADSTGRIATAERILNEQLIRLKVLIIRAHAHRTSHDGSSIIPHAHDRASDVVKKEVDQIRRGLDELQGPTPQHRFTAMSTLFVRLNKDLESLLLTDDHVKKRQMSYDQTVIMQERERQLDAHLTDLATKDQRLGQLEREISAHHDTNESLARTNEALSKELEKLHRNNVMANQNAVELRMQGLDFKARIENRLNRVLHSISTRMGFVPAGIVKEMDALRSLKAPGDPHYNDVLHQAYTKTSLKKMQKLLGDIPAISGMFDETDILVDPYSGKMTLLDGTPVADKNDASRQEAKDRLRMIGYSPARNNKAGKEQVSVNLPSANSTSASSSSSTAPSDSMESELHNRSELIDQGRRSESLLQPRSPEGARRIEGRERTPRTQEEWVRWALNSDDVELPLSPASRQMQQAAAEAAVEAAGDAQIKAYFQAQQQQHQHRPSVSSTWAEPPSGNSSTAPAGEIEMKIYQDFAADMDDEDDDSDYRTEDEEQDDDDDDDDEEYVQERVAAIQQGRFYELESVSTQGVDDDFFSSDVASYEAGKSKTAQAIANAAGGSTYVDPRASVRSSVSSLGDVPGVRSAWNDQDDEVVANEVSKTEEELGDIRAFLSHVRAQRGIAESELAPYLK